MSQDPLRRLPPVNEVLDHPVVRALIEERGRERVLAWVRQVLIELRASSPEPANADREALLAETVARTRRRAADAAAAVFGKVINATGVVLHTSLGRSPLAQAAVRAIAEASGGCNLEVDLATGERRERGYQLAEAWSELTGAEASLVVNNNAAATLLALRGLCRGREVLISRGQLVEIGGSFRLPDVFVESGATLREVGTTNRTRLEDYVTAITPQTAAILRVHTSNYRIVGFSETPGMSELARLAHERGLFCLDDIGSGCLVDTTQFGLPREPTFAESLAAGADLVLGSGDKLLGGPQCGILLGRSEVVERLRRHPLARAIRIDKLTLAALSATLEAYRRGTALREVPTLAMLGATVAELRQRAETIATQIAGRPSLTVDLRDDSAVVGGGSLPGAELPTVVLELRHAEFSAEELARRLRVGSPRVFATIRRDRVCLDLRSVLPADDVALAAAVNG